MFSELWRKERRDRVSPCWAVGGLTAGRGATPIKRIRIKQRIVFI